MIEHMNNLVDRLCNTNRWETYDVIDSYSVAEHSYIVANISYEIALSVDECDEDEVVKRALFHDIEEAHTSDLPRFAKRGNDNFEKALEEVENQVVEDILSNKDCDDNYSDNVMNLWKNSKDKSIEGLVIKQADILAALYDVYREVNKGNSRIKEYDDVSKGIEYAVEICSGTEKSEKFLNEILDNINWDDGFD